MLAHAASIVSGITFTPTVFNSTGNVFTTRGYAFDITDPGLEASGLSIFDENGDGLSEAHQVGLWDPAGNLIASATIPAGTGAALLDGFRYVDITPVSLPVGDGYIVGGLYMPASADRQVIGLSNLMTAPGLTYVEGVVDNTATSLTLVRAVNSTGANFIGGSLTLTSTPEPGSWLLVLCGAALLAIGLIIRNKSEKLC